MWLQLTATLVIASLLTLAWLRYSLESDGRRRAAELCLWVTPVLPFLIAALCLVISGSPVSVANPVPTGIWIVAPATALCAAVLVLVIRTLKMQMRVPSRDSVSAPGLIIVGSTIVWFAAVAWPGAELSQIAQHRMEHIFASAAFLLGALLTLAGFAVVDAQLAEAGERLLSRLGIVALFIGTVCWAIHLTFRLTVALSVSIVGGTKVPDWYPPMKMWAGSLYALYMPLSYLALAAFGSALQKSGSISRKWGRSFIAFGLIATAGFIARIGLFDPPLLVNIPAYAIAMLLLRSSVAHNREYKLHT